MRAGSSMSRRVQVTASGKKKTAGGTERKRSGEHRGVVGVALLIDALFERAAALWGWERPTHA